MDKKKTILLILTVAITLISTITVKQNQYNRLKDPQPNIILITLDTLRNSRLSKNNYISNTSEFLDQLAQQGVSFENAYASSSHTACSHASILTGLEVAQHAVYMNGQKINDEVPTIADFLNEQNYKTHAIVSVNFIKGLEKGFQTHDTKKEKIEVKPKPDEILTEKNIPYIPAEKILDKAYKWIKKEKKEKIFLWIHVFDIHEKHDQFEQNTIYKKDAEKKAYKKNQGQLSEYLNFLKEKEGIGTKKQPVENYSQINQNYDAKIVYVDNVLEEFYNKIQELNLPNTIWIITSDHGEGLGSHNYEYHAEHLYEEQIRVPLIILGDGIPQGKTINELVRHVDILPTISDIIQEKIPKQKMSLQGESLLPLIYSNETWTPKYAFSQRRKMLEKHLKWNWEPSTIFALTSQTHKYIYHSNGTNEFYNLQKDPLEKTNLVGKGGEKEKEMKKTILEKYTGYIKEKELYNNQEQEEISEDIRKQLTELGYLT